MLETVAPFLAAAFGKDDAGRAQPRQRGFELTVALRCNRVEQSKRELPANDRSDLRHLACLAEAVEPSHERILECRRHRRVVLPRRFHHALGQLLPTTRNTILQPETAF